MTDRPEGPEGWYPDPLQPGRERYWFGDHWSELNLRPAEPSTATATTTARPQGWYPDPDDSNLQRYWHGDSWSLTDVRWAAAHQDERPAPLLGRPPDAAPIVFIALSPLLGLLASALIATQTHTYSALGAGWLVYLAVNVGLIAWDRTMLSRRGLNDAGWLVGTLLMPVYVWRRQQQVRGSQGMLAIWIVAFVLAVALSAPVLGLAVHSGGVTGPLDTTNLARMIQAQQPAGATVTCPSSESGLAPGSTFECVLALSDGSADNVTVTVVNSKGYVTWHVDIP